MFHGLLLSSATMPTDVQTVFFFNIAVKLGMSRTAEGADGERFDKFTERLLHSSRLSTGLDCHEALPRRLLKVNAP